MIAAIGAAGGVGKKGRRGTPPAPPAPQALAGFYLGHSLTNFDMPQMVMGIAESLGHTHPYQSKIGIGAALKAHYDQRLNELAAQSWPDETIATEPWLQANPYDVASITEAVPVLSQYTSNDSVLHAGQFYDLLTGDAPANPDCQVYLYQHWAFTDEPDFAAWRAQIDTDRAVWIDIASEVNAARPGAPNPMQILPGGEAIAALYDTLTDSPGTIPFYTAITDFFEDNVHLNNIGNYFIACVHFATFYRVSPVGASGALINRFETPFTPVNTDALPALQQLAWDVVQTWFASGGGL